MFSAFFTSALRRTACKTEGASLASPADALENSMPVKPVLVPLAFLGLSLFLASCGGDPDRMNTNAIPDDYRTRHPIVVADVQHSVDVPVAAGSPGLTQGAKDMIFGFAQDYRNASTSYVQILVPRGSANQQAASSIAKQVHQQLVLRGIASAKIVERYYQAAASGDAAPIRMSYVASTAVAGPCGQWPEDLAIDTTQNKNWQNFGCASQANLAAQLDSPNDLVAPRGMSPIDATRRSTVITNYRNGTDTSTGSSGSSTTTTTTTTTN